jgi:glycosyltransferase involved in cell wall biosynthesis
MHHPQELAPILIASGVFIAMSSCRFSGNFTGGKRGRITMFGDKKRVRVGFIAPSIHYGGGEIWMYNIIKFGNQEKLTWSICVIADHWNTPSLILKMAALIPIYSNGYLYHGDRKFEYTLDMAINYLKNNSDVIVGWEFDERRANFIRDSNCEVINVLLRKDLSHSKYVLENQHLASVSYNCIDSFGEVKDRAIKVIPVGIDINNCFPIKSKADMRKQWAISNESIVIGYVGRMDPVKNLNAIARAVTGLKGDAYAVCYGAKNFEVDRIQRELKYIAGDKLMWFDPIDDLGSILNAVDVFMLPSYSEVFSLSLLEAWTAGIPVVATLVGETPELEKRYGKLIIPINPEDSSEVLAQAVQKAVNDQAVKEITERAQKMVLENYNINKIASLWSDYFSEIGEKTSL